MLLDIGIKIGFFGYFLFRQWLTKESSPAGFLLPDFPFTFEFSAIHPAVGDILQAF